MSALPESKRLIVLEKTIEKGKRTFIEVGVALAEIRDLKLYKLEHETFEQYCKERWGWGRAYAYQLINESSVVNSLPASVSTVVDNHEKARELAKVEPEKREEVLEKAVATAQAEERPLAAHDIKTAYGDFPDPEEETTPPTNDDKWKNAFGGSVPKLIPVSAEVREKILEDMKIIRADMTVVESEFDRGSIEASASYLIETGKAWLKLARL